MKTYRGGVTALSGVSFAVEAGTVFALLGPNGAGKSTTVKILTTLSKPDSGSARVAGYDVARQPRQVRRAIGVVTQSSGVALEATGRENLVLQARLHGLRGAELTARTSDLLERFGLADAAGRLARTYSGGMLRKLDVAIGLVNDPAVLFLDEPTTGLDPEARAAMWDEIAGLAAGGLTILLTTHYLAEADQLASLLAIIEGGRVVAGGTPDELKSELHGDAIHLELAGGPTEFATARDLLAGMDGFTEIRSDGRELSARVGRGAAVLPAVLGRLDTAGVTVAAATVARPSLDDVYLRYVGRRFAAGEDTKEGS